jgi:hypothetical protein
MWYFGPDAGRAGAILSTMGIVVHEMGAFMIGLDDSPAGLAEEIFAWMGAEYAQDLTQALLALVPPGPAPAPPTPTTPPAQGAPGTIAEQIVAVLHAAPGGLANPAIAKALGKKLTDTFEPLKRLIKRGHVRKEGVTYFLVEPQEVG